jgi:eukaryotic-like serine/threonine-protein kinase
MNPASRSDVSGSIPPAPANPSLDLSGKTLGDFRLLRRLGQGGMGQVYLAEQLALKRKVAVKVMRQDLAINETSYQRFRAEAEAIARITHANIVQVYAFGEEAGLHYMALEYVEGRNLREYLDRKGPPDLPLALSILRQAAAALQRASELGIVHRDIKPENILLTRRGEVKVADFGLSRVFAGTEAATHLTQPGLTMGTPLYMSPEQIQGQEVDPRTDIYSLGVTCYHMLAGQPPFRGQTALELAIHHVTTEPPPLAGVRPDLPADLCAMVHRMMAKEPDKRYPTCAELLKDLARIRASAGLQASQATETAMTPAASAATQSLSALLPPLLPPRWLLGVAAATVLLALAGGGALAWVINKSKAGPLLTQGEAQAAAVLSKDQTEERYMREDVERYADPGQDSARVDLGLRHCVELGLFYLQRHRLDDADQFFKGLRENPYKVEVYRTLGSLGQAIVLGLQSKPLESNKAFLELLGEKRRAARQPAGLPALLAQPKVREQISLALEYNQANATRQNPFPQELEEFRLAPKAPRRAGLGKAADKGG